MPEQGLSVDNIGSFTVFEQQMLKILTHLQLMNNKKQTKLSAQTGMNSRTFMSNGNVVTRFVAKKCKQRNKHDFRTFHGVFDARITTVRGLKTEARCCVCSRCASTLALTADSFSVTGVAFDGLVSEGSLSTTVACATLDACCKRSVGRIIKKHGGNTKCGRVFVECKCRQSHLQNCASRAIAVIYLGSPTA